MQPLRTRDPPRSGTAARSRRNAQSHSEVHRRSNADRGEPSQHEEECLMAVVPVTINCVIFPKAKGGSVPQPYPATIVGNAWVTGLSVDNQPPGAQPPPIETPPGQPVFPIWGPPGIELPPGAGYPPVASHLLPEPPNGGAPPDPPDMVK